MCDICRLTFTGIMSVVSPFAEMFSINERKQSVKIRMGPDIQFVQVSYMLLDGYHPISIHFKKQLPEELKVMYGEPLQLTVEAVGAPPLHYVWCRNQEIISDAIDGPVLSVSYRCICFGMYSRH